MNKTILKEFAIASRNELIDKIKTKLSLFYVDEKFLSTKNGDIYELSNELHSLKLSEEEFKKRELLINRINELGIEQVIEESAYTWFNRLVAIRYMEIHDFLPLGKNNESLGIRVLSSQDNTPNPEILKFNNLIDTRVDIDFDKNKYSKLSTDNEKFKYVIQLVCNKLKNVFPDIFGNYTDYIDILIPENMLSESGFIYKMIKELSIENFEKVEIIGWLYQYYISEKKDEVFKELKSGKKVEKKNIPAATQIFTPDWIVKYMVENTLGRYTSNEFKKTLKYYDFVKTEDETMKNISEIKFIDPCCGSGHILVYAFELFYKIYEYNGYSKKDIVSLILQNNLYGLDIDDRAGQLSILSVLLKAREYDRNLFSSDVIKKLHITSIKDSNSNLKDNLIYLLNNQKNIDEYQKIVDQYTNAKEIGSLLICECIDSESLINNINKDNIFSSDSLKLIDIIKCNEILSKKYDVVVTNPPYMGNRGMDKKLDEYIKKHYSNFKTDMFSAFIKQAYNLTNENGYYALITQPTFLFISSFEKVREHLIENNNIISLLHMGRGIFGIDFGSCSFIARKKINKNFIGNYYKLNKRTFQYIKSEDIEKLFLTAKSDSSFSFDFDSYTNENDEIDYSDIDNKKMIIKYTSDQSNFNKIPSYPFAYWISDNFIDVFSNKKLSDYGVACVGLQTSDNKRFLREWYEVDFNKIGFGIKNIDDSVKSKKKWFPYNKGGDYRKWFGNCMEIVNWENDGAEIREYNNYLNSTRSSNIGIANTQYYFKESGTWGLVSSAKFSVRYSPVGAVFDTGGSSLFSNDILKYLIGLLNTNLTQEIMHIQNPTLNFQPGNVSNIPVIIKDKEIIEGIVDENISLAKEDWDSYETSWDFTTHPLLKYNYKTLSECYKLYCDECDKRKEQMKYNETKLNERFINIYQLNDEISSEVSDKDITLSSNNELRDIKSFISYSVGCMFGRYSLDTNGLIYAGGDFDLDDYKKYIPDVDNIIPISDSNEIYFNDDIVGKFKDFLTNVFGKENLQANLDYIAEVLGKKGIESSEDTIRKYFVNDFYNDHLKIYMKKPIYWMFDSGKKNGFKCLVYMHRYNKKLVSMIRVNYLHKTQDAYERIFNETKEKLESNELTVQERKMLSNKLSDLNNKITELNSYYEKVAHYADKMIEINLDDGIKDNYEKFSDILFKIK